MLAAAEGQNAASCTEVKKEMGGLIAAIVILTVLLAGLFGWMYYRQRNMEQAMRKDKMNFSNDQDASLNAAPQEEQQPPYGSVHSPLADL
jgi:uncharacterized protein HemX